MKTFLPFLFILFGFNIGYNQTSLQYVFSNESHRFYDVSNFKNVQIGVGQFHPCTYAYICALSDNNQSKWEKSFDFLSYSFFSDILRVNDSTFYAVGEEWLADDIESIISILLVKMDINGNLLLFKKITDPQLLNNQNFYVNCKIQELPNKDLVISAGNKLAYLTADGVIYKYTFLTNKVKDFELITQDEFYYISESGLFHYDQINHEELVLTGYQGLNSLNLYNSGIYFMDQNGKLYRSDLNGQNITIFSDSIGLKHVVDFEFNKDKLYIIGDDLNGINQLFVLDEIDFNNNKTVSLATIRNVSYSNIDVDESAILISGTCDYGWPNIFFITMDHNYNLPNLSKDLGISDFKQIEYTRTIDTILGGFFIYNHHFSFEYKITNHGLDPVEFFNVYSDDYFHINCFHSYFYYNYKEELRPGESIILSGTGDIVHIGSPVIGICLKVVASDNELDLKPDDNINCKTLVINEDLSLIDSGFKVFPNPVYDIIHLSSESSADFTIYNSTGILIYELKNIKNVELNIKDFQAGVYFIKDNSKNSRSLAKKFIKL